MQIAKKISSSSSIWFLRKSVYDSKLGLIWEIQVNVYFDMKFLIKKKRHIIKKLPHHYSIRHRQKNQRKLIEGTLALIIENLGTSSAY